MARLDSPLRYPGGKTTLWRFLASVIETNDLEDCIYAEPYAGGAGAALSLLYTETVSEIWINDADNRVHAFWWAILNRTEEFLRLVREAPLTIDFWRQQLALYRKPGRAGRLSLGFATFYLNRCNRSGIMVNGGPIGGINQDGKWKIDARFNRETLAQRIERVASYRDRIRLTCHDALDFLHKDIATLCRRGRDVFVYLDPPYYAKGRLLYMNSYEHDDHRALARHMRRRKPYSWLMTYDNAPQIRELYSGFDMIPFDLRYSAYKQRSGEELLIHDGSLSLPLDLLTAAQG